MSGASAEHHYGDDETLLAYLDRELPEGERQAVERHLAECWSCRTRAAEIEQGVHIATRAIEEESSRSGDEIKRALHEFFRRRTEFESRRRPSLFARCALPPLSWRPIPLAFVAAAVALIVIASIRPRGPREPLPEAVVAQAKASEETLRRSRRPTHQVLRVEARTSSEPAGRDFGTLEIWSDSAAGGRYSSSWRDARNILRHAVWKPAAATRYTYDPAVRRAVPCSRPLETKHMVDEMQGAVDLASMERGFLKWVSGRTWMLVSFADEWAAFVERGGVRVLIERLRKGPRNLWRLSATRADVDRTFEMILQVDTETYLPSVQAIRVTVAGRVSELTLTVDRWHSVPSHELRPAVFAPAPSIPFLDWRPSPPALPAPAAPPPLPGAPDRVPLPEWALADLEFRVRSALHEALQCVDVSIGRESGAGIVVQPLFSDGPPPAALERTLEGIEGRDYVRIVPAAGRMKGGASHRAMIWKHVRTMREIAASAHQLIGLSPLQERQLARLFADHWRGLRLEMAHLAVRLRGAGEAAGMRALSLPTGNIADFPVASHFLESAATQAVLSKVDLDAAALADREDTDSDSMERLVHVLSTLDGHLISLEDSMRAGSSHASR